MPDRYKYYYYELDQDGDISVIGTNDKQALIDLGFHNEYSALETFTIGKKVAYLKFIHSPITFDVANRPQVFIVQQYDLTVSNLPFFEYRFVSFMVANTHFHDIKLRLSRVKAHPAPIKTYLPDLSVFINTDAVIDIPIELSDQHNHDNLTKYIKIIDAAKDGKGGFLYPLYVKLNHPIEQFWVRLIKYNDKYYGIVENKIIERQSLGFTHLDVVSFGYTHIEALI